MPIPHSNAYARSKTWAGRCSFKPPMPAVRLPVPAVRLHMPAVKILCQLSESEQGLMFQSKGWEKPRRCVSPSQQGGALQRSHACFTYSDCRGRQCNEDCGHPIKNLFINTLLHVSKLMSRPVRRLPIQGGHRRHHDTWGVWIT